MTDIILASASPRRAELLTLLGLSFQILPPDIDERINPQESAEHVVHRLAREKALSIAEKYSQACVIAADTVVTRQTTILGKPKNHTQALEMLQFLAGGKHDVLTGMAIAFNQQIWQAVVKTEVEMIPYDEKLFQAYVDSGESLDKAGGYAIQGRGSVLIKQITGDFYNVVGLPLQALREGLSALSLEKILLQAWQNLS